MKKNKKSKVRDARKKRVIRALVNLEAGYSLANCCGDTDVDWKEIDRVDSALAYSKIK